MDDLNNFLEAVGAMAEMSAAYYSALITTGLDDETAATITAKLMAEIIRPDAKQKGGAQ